VQTHVEKLPGAVGIAISSPTRHGRRAHGIAIKSRRRKSESGLEAIVEIIYCYDPRGCTGCGMSGLCSSMTQRKNSFSR
jgi:hypothetical protein